MAQTQPLAVKQGLRDGGPRTCGIRGGNGAPGGLRRYGDDAYSRGITVWTTIRKADQEAAWQAVRKGVIDYDHRHGYRGPEAFVAVPDTPTSGKRCSIERSPSTPTTTNLLAAIVDSASLTEIKATLATASPS